MISECGRQNKERCAAIRDRYFLKVLCSSYLYVDLLPYQCVLSLEDFLRHFRPKDQMLRHIVRLNCVQGVQHSPVIEEAHMSIELYLAG
jgi:hypothetical protein